MRCAFEGAQIGIVDGFLLQLLSELAANLSAKFLYANFGRIFEPGFKKLNDEIEYYPRDAQERIVVNVNNYINTLDKEVRDRELADDFNSEKASTNLASPKVQRITANAAVFAAMNNDLLLIENLVTLVVAALQAEEGSQLAQVTMLSEQVLEKLRPENLRQLAVIFGAKAWRPSDAALACEVPERQLEMIDTELKPFADAFRGVNILDPDAMLLEESGAVIFRLSLSGFTDPRFVARNMQYLEIYQQAATYPGDYAALGWFLSRTQAVGFGRPPYMAPHFALTLSGYALGYITLAKVTGETIELQRMLGLT